MAVSQEQRPYKKSIKFNSLSLTIVCQSPQHSETLTMSPKQFQELLENAWVHVTPVYISAVIPDHSREGRGKQMAVKRHVCAIMKPTGVCALTVNCEQYANFAQKPR